MEITNESFIAPEQSLSFKYKLSVVIGLSVCIFALDQATKIWAVETLLGHEPTYYLKGIFQFVYAENPGAFLGFGGGWSRAVRFIIFAVLVLGGLGAMLWYLLKKETSRINLFAYSFILAGGLGNLWDRVVHEQGHVIDFMLIDFGGFMRTGVFNIADVAIVIGVLMAFLSDYLTKKSHQKKIY